ncbi:ABC-type uncharacterized transport system [compost metagenome]
MKILKIAKLEISILFYSPVAWLVLAIFVVQSGTGFFTSFAMVQEAISMGERTSDLTASFFIGMSGLFTKILDTLYLYIPLLSMGVMSREMSSGSIKLLLSSPVKIKEIILGKYLALVGYGAILVLILAGYGVIAAITIDHADIYLILSGLTGIFLLICTYSAIGLFMSSLTSYQVVAAISTLAVFAVLRYVGGIGQRIDFIRDLTYFLSISGRADEMLKGLISSKDVIYFILIICLFLSLCILRLQAGRESKHWTVLTGKYTLLICLILFTGYLSSRPALIGYIDMTATKSMTLTRGSQDTAKKIDGELEINTYVNLLDRSVYSGLPVSRNGDLSLFDGYRRFLPGLKMNYVYYYDVEDLKNSPNLTYQGDISGMNKHQIAEKVAENMELDLDDFMSPDQIRKQINLIPEGNTLVRQFRYKGKTSWLRFYNDFNRIPGEAEITAALKRLIAGAPKVAFITGDNERSIEKSGDRNYLIFSNSKPTRRALINQGFEVFNIDLSTQEIPDSLSVLVLGDPTTALTAVAQKKIKAYLNKGGNMLITGEPGRQQILNPLLEHIGVQLLNGTLVSPSEDNAPDLIMGTFSKQAKETDTLFARLRRSGTYMIMQGTAGLSFDRSAGFKTDTLVTSPEFGWNKQGPIDLAATDVKFNPMSGDQPGPFPIVLSMTKNKGSFLQKIIVSGDADFMSNGELAKDRSYNEQFTLKLFKWFSNGRFPVEIKRAAKLDNSLKVNKKQVSALKVAYLGVLPALIVALGSFILIRRKRK